MGIFHPVSCNQWLPSPSERLGFGRIGGGGGGFLTSNTKGFMVDVLLYIIAPRVTPKYAICNMKMSAMHLRFLNQCNYVKPSRLLKAHFYKGCDRGAYI